MAIKALFTEILALVLAAVLKNRRSRASKREAPPEDNNIFQVNLIKHQEILPARWNEMARQKREDKDFGFEAWRYDPATDAQKDRLLREGAPKTLFIDTTKGQASDLIGISQPADPELVEVLQYFKLWEDGMSVNVFLNADVTLDKALLYGVGFRIGHGQRVVAFERFGRLNGAHDFNSLLDFSLPLGDCYPMFDLFLHQLKKSNGTPRPLRMAI